MTEQQIQEIIWWKDKKLMAGFILVVISIALGFYGKALSIVKFYEPVYLLTGLSLWAFSFVILFFGVFLVGRETVKMIQQRIHHHVKKTYHHAKELPRKSYHYTKELRKKGIDKIKKSTKVLVQKINKRNG